MIGALHVGTLTWVRISRTTGSGVGVAALGPAAGDEPVGQDRLGQSLHVVGHDVVAPERDGERLGGAVESERGPRARAELHLAV